MNHNPNPFRSSGQARTQPLRATVRMRASKPSRSMFSGQRGTRVSGGWLFLVALIVVGLSITYNIFVNNMVQVEGISVTVPALDPTFEGYSILHISDLHGKRFGSGQSLIRAALRNRSYNVVCITGDMVGPDGDPYPFYELIECLDPRVPIYFIPGDEDPQVIMTEPHYSNDVLAEFVQGAQRRGAIYLDAPRSLVVGGKKLWVLPESQLSLDLDAAEQSFRNQLKRDQEGGNAELAGIKARSRALNYQLEILNRVREARASMQGADLQIALVHHPLQSDFVRNLQNWSATDSTTVSSQARQVDLVLAGHNNGGQACLPFIGPLYVPGRGWLPGERRTHGLMQVGGVTQFVSAGLGVSRAYSVPFRMFNAPRIALLRLTTSSTR